jgi:hypothetical protein
MTKALSSYPEGERGKVIERRLAEEKGGLGYLAARDAQARKARDAKAKAVEARVAKNKAAQAEA